MSKQIKSFVSLVAAVAASLTLYLPGLAATDTVGAVLEIKGKWIAKPKSGKEQKLVDKGAIPNNVQIIATEPSSSSKLTIVLVDGRKISCSNSSPNEISVTNTPSFGERLQSVLNQLTQGPTQFISAITRSGDGELQDAVVVESERGVSLESIFVEVDPKKHHFDVVELSDGERKLHEGVVFSYDRDNPKVITGHVLSPGLYALRAVDDQGKETGQDAWFLVSRSSRYQKDVSEFDEGRKLTESWNDVNPDSTRCFMRAYLKSLSQADLPEKEAKE